MFEVRPDVRAYGITTREKNVKQALCYDHECYVLQCTQTHMKSVYLLHFFRFKFRRKIEILFNS